jgi:hypothetical protein
LAEEGTFRKLGVKIVASKTDDGDLIDAPEVLFEMV